MNAQLQWEQVDQGWGRKAVDFASLMEPQNVREYVNLLTAVGVGPGVRVLDVACGAGLALEVAAAMGAIVAGTDASHRLLAIAQNRVPGADLVVGDMRDLPWDDDAFDVVVSFRGIWGTTPEVLPEVRRVLRPGGRFGLTVWGHVKASPGAWALTPFRWAAAEKVAHQSAMNSWGRPGAGEAALEAAGFVDVDRHSVPCALEFPDPEGFARALTSNGPSFEAIQEKGEPEFVQDAAALARIHGGQPGLPLRAEIDMVGLTATNPAEPVVGASFLAEPAELTEEARAIYDDDLAELGFVMNGTRMWAHDATAVRLIFEGLQQATDTGSLSLRERGVLVMAAAASRGDSYCALSWGGKMARRYGEEFSISALTGTGDGLTDREQALRTWALAVTRDANAVTLGDVDALRRVGYTDAQVLALTTFTALRMAFSTVNDALGSSPDLELVEQLPDGVRRAVTWGRPVSQGDTASRADGPP